MREMNFKDNQSFIGLIYSSAFSNITGKALFFLYNVLLARMLGIEFFGYYAAIFVAVRFIDIFSRSGLVTESLRLLSVEDENNWRRLSCKIVSIPACIGTILAGFGIIVVKIFYPGEAIDEAWFAFLIAPVSAAFYVSISIIQAAGGIACALRLREIYLQGALVAGLLALFFFDSVSLSCVIAMEGVIYSFLFAYAIRSIFSRTISVDKAEYSEICDRESSQRTKYIAPSAMAIWFGALPLMINALSQFSVNWLDIIFLSYYRSSEEVGAYRAVVQISLSLSLILVTVNGIYAPSASRLRLSIDPSRASEMLGKSIRYIFYPLVFASTLIVLYADTVILIFFGEAYLVGADALRLQVVCQALLCLGGGAGYTIALAGKQSVLVKIAVSAVVFMCVLCLLLIPVFGMSGAALSATVAALFMISCRLLYLQLVLDVLIWRGGTFLPVLTWLCAVTAYCILGSFPPSSYDLLLQVSFISISAISFFWCLNKNRSDMDLVSKLSLRGRK